MESTPNPEPLIDKTSLEKLDELSAVLVNRKGRYSKKAYRLYGIISIPIILAIILFCRYGSTYIPIIVGLIALVGTLMAYIEIYYRKEIDLIENKIEAIKVAKFQVVNATSKPIDEECFEKLQKNLL